ncbi:MAG: PQQ-binding-like beta-propeller repeat protein [Planctomycetes bacterium]|nr:PQQ-binding-like beta-propeller repeat protein [Planctomycetota bacterium]
MSSILVPLLTMVLLPAQATGEPLPWPDRNGPTRDGRALAEHAEGLPVRWDEASGQNIAWKIAIEGHGHSTPVIGLGRLWFTAATYDGTQQFVYCVDAATGAVLHHKLMFENPDPEPLGNDINTYASPSCVLEGDAVYVHFGTYGTARLDPETAETIWQRRDIRCRHFRGPGSSPVLCGDLLILTFDGIDQQFLTALDKRTGKTVWRTDRSTDFQDLEPDGKPRREGDLRKAYGTPGVAEVGGRMQVISVGARAAFGYDALTGEEIWTIQHEDYNAAIRPLLLPPLVILNTGSRGSNQMGLRLDETTLGNVTETHVEWDRTRGNPRLSTPVLVNERLYMATDLGVLYCLNARTGEEIFSERLRGAYTASPVYANGKIYLCNEDGVTTVIEAADEFKSLARNEVSGHVRASPAVASGALYLRTFDHLYKIARRP